MMIFRVCLFVLYLVNLSARINPLHMTSSWASGGQIYIFINFQKSVNFDKMLKYRLSENCMLLRLFLKPYSSSTLAYLLLLESSIKYIFKDYDVSAKGL